MSKKRQKKFLKLYEPIHERFEKFCRARAYGDFEYEDLINESVLIAYSKMDQLKNSSSFLSFLIGISIKLLANANRKNKAEIMDDSSLTKVADPNDQFDKKFEIDLLHKSMAQLPEQQREALILFEITGFSIKEIMDIQDSSESAVKQRLSRARKELSLIINKEMSHAKSKEK